MPTCEFGHEVEFKDHTIDKVWEKFIEKHEVEESFASTGDNDYSVTTDLSDPLLLPVRGILGLDSQLTSLEAVVPFDEKNSADGFTSVVTGNIMTAFEITLNYRPAGDGDTICHAFAKVEVDPTLEVLLPPGMLEGALRQLLDVHINTLRQYLDPPAEQSAEDLEAEYSYFSGF